MNDPLEKKMPAPDHKRDDRFEESIVSLHSFDTPKDRVRAKESIGIARMRLAACSRPVPDALDRAVSQIIRQLDLNDLDARSDDDALEISLRDLRALQRAHADSGSDSMGSLSYHLEWIAAPRPPVHPDEMTGRQIFRTFEDAVRFMSFQPDDSRFVSLTQRGTRESDISEAAGAAIESLKAERERA